MLRSLVSGSKLRPDASQAAAIRALSLLQTFACLEPPRPGASAVAAANGRISTPLGGTNGNERPAPKICGAYLWGPVGSGKTVCLDLFYKTMPLAGPSGADTPFLSVAPARIADTAIDGESPGDGRMLGQKRRLHYHEFMLRVHQRLHVLQQGRPKVLGHSRLGLPVYRCIHLENGLKPMVVRLCMRSRPPKAAFLGGILVCHHKVSGDAPRVVVCPLVTLALSSLLPSCPPPLNLLEAQGAGHRPPEGSRPTSSSVPLRLIPSCRYEEPAVAPLDQVVAEVAATTRVLCLDELHVTDVADAMILSR